MRDLTPPERRCLGVINDILSAGRQPSMTEVAKALGVTKGAAQHHMRNLRELGVLKGPVVVGKWWIPSAGKRALGKASREA